MIADLAEGTLLAGKYRVEHVLGRGGMGVVVAARHVQLDQRVAVKLMLPQALQSSEAVARFIREARAAARIASDHVVRVFDVGTLESGQPYMAMEYLDGTDLGAIIASRGRIPPEECIGYVLEACEAIAEAHASGVVHRDIKPSNLFLARKRDGTTVLKVLDFGISKVTQQTTGSDGAVTRTAALMGSPLYMSPEQMASSRDVDARSDIWALGVVLYEALTGTLPFMADTLPQICVAVMNHDLEPPTRRAPALPTALGDVVLRCLAKQPNARFSTVAELAVALAPFAVRAAASVDRITRSLAGRPFEVKPIASEAQTTPSPTIGAWGRTRAPASRHSVLALLGLLVVGATGGAAWISLRSRPIAVTEAAKSAATSELPIATAPAPPPLATAPAVPSATVAKPVETPAVRPRSRRIAPPSATASKPVPTIDSRPTPTASSRSDLGKPGARSRL